MPERSAQQQQSEIYGAPLADILGHCGEVLGVRQQQLAELLGISAPMLSQLVNGRRIKLANPVAAQRLRSLVELVQRVDAGELGPREVLEQMAALPAGPALTTRLATSTPGLGGDIQRVFRAAASAGDYLAAAQSLQAGHPAVAELLRVYGTERSDRAEDFTRRLLHGQPAAR